MTLRPFRQGALDSMCGVYAVINATRLAAWPQRRLSEASCHELFGVLASALDEEGYLLKLLIEGSFYPVVSRLLRVADEWLEMEHRLRLYFRRPFHTRLPDGDQTLLRLSSHLTAPQTAAIVCMTSHENYHWSVVRAVTRKGSLVLFDSGARRYLLRVPARPRAGSSARRLFPRDLYLVWTTT